MQAKQLSVEEGNKIIDTRLYFRFKYRCLDYDLHVDIPSSSLNDAMVFFATRYHLVDEVYNISKITPTHNSKNKSNGTD